MSETQDFPTQTVEVKKQEVPWTQLMTLAAAIVFAVILSIFVLRDKLDVETYVVVVAPLLGLAPAANAVKNKRKKTARDGAARQPAKPKVVVP